MHEGSVLRESHMQRVKVHTSLLIHLSRGHVTRLMGPSNIVARRKADRSLRPPE